MVGSWDGSESDDSSHFERGVDHIYEAFICLLTKVVMHDPVLADALRGIAGQLGNLVVIIPISEEQAAAAELLAELRERDLALTREMLSVGAFEKIISKVIGIHQGELRG